MANKSISMTQVQRIIQLKTEGLSKLKISQSLHIHRATLDNYFFKLAASGKDFPELLECSDEQLTSFVYTDPVIPKADNRIEDLQKHLDYFKEELTRTGVTRKTLWEEYHEAYPEGYQYAQFCVHFARHVKITKATMHLTHRAGDYLQVDFAGKKLHYVDIQTGEIVSYPVLICTLPFSGYTYVEALPSAGQTCHGARRVWRGFCKSRYKFCRSRACRGTSFIGAGKLSRYRIFVGGTGAVSRYKFDQSQKSVTVQDLYCGQMSVSGCKF